MKRKLIFNITIKTIKEPSRKQVIIPISKDNARIIASQANAHASNINRLLKEVKSEVLANFIWFNNKGIIITTNKAVANLDLKVVEEYIKELNNINLNKVIYSHLPQFKSYLKILRVSYYMVNTNSPITSDIMEKIIKKAHIFNNIILVSHFCIIKAFPKSDITIIWVNIWNSHNSIKTKSLIKRYFDIEQYIAMICETNINPSIL